MRGKRAHEDDWAAVVERARSAGVVGQILTGDCLAGSKESLELAKGQGAHARRVLGEARLLTCAVASQTGSLRPWAATLAAQTSLTRS